MKYHVNSFKKSLLQQKQQYGLWLGLCSSLSAELCAQCGYDWLLIDAEHAPNDLQTIHTQLLAIENNGGHAIVRLVDGNVSLIKQVLDLGAQTLLIPMVETAEQAEKLVRAVRYPPNGIRGVGTALARAARWNNLDDYLVNADQQICLIVQVESLDGIANLDEILKVNGVDGVFIGPADLAASMGLIGKPSSPAVVNVIENALTKIRSARKAAGILATSKELAKHYEAFGAQFIALGVDTLLLGSYAKTLLNDYIKNDCEIVENNGAY